MNDFQSCINDWSSVETLYLDLRILGLITTSGGNCSVRFVEFDIVFKDESVVERLAFSNERPQCDNHSEFRFSTEKKNHA